MANEQQKEAALDIHIIPESDLFGTSPNNLVESQNTGDILLLVYRSKLVLYEEKDGIMKVSSEIALSDDSKINASNLQQGALLVEHE